MTLAEETFDPEEEWNELHEIIESEVETLGRRRHG